MMPGNVFGRPAETEATEATDPAGPVTGVLGGDDPADVDAGRG
jgi:ethanolamine utilization microcompartment shell protein EutL